METFLDLEELLLAVQVKHALHHCPVIASLACSDDGRLPGGATLEEAFAKLRAAEADVVGINCVNSPAAAVRLLENIADDGPRVAFPSAGLPVQRVWPATPADFARAVPLLAERGVRLIGGCCGTRPEHVAAIVKALAAFTEETATHPSVQSR